MTGDTTSVDESFVVNPKVKYDPFLRSAIYPEERKEYDEIVAMKIVPELIESARRPDGTHYAIRPMKRSYKLAPWKNRMLPNGRVVLRDPSEDGSPPVLAIDDKGGEPGPRPMGPYPKATQEQIEKERQKNKNSKEQSWGPTSDPGAEGFDDYPPPPPPQHGVKEKVSMGRPMTVLYDPKHDPVLLAQKIEKLSGQRARMLQSYCNGLDAYRNVISGAVAKLI